MNFQPETMDDVSQVIEDRAYLKSIVDTVGVGVLILDESKEFIYANLTLRSWLSRSLEELRTLPTSAYHRQSPAANTTQIHNTIIDSGRWEGDVCLISADQEEIPCRLVAHKVQTQLDGRRTLVGVYTDLRELKRSRERENLLVDIIQELSTRTDLEGVARRALFRAAELTGGNGGGIALKDDEQPTLSYRWTTHEHAEGHPEHRFDKPFPADQGLAGIAFRTGRAQIANHYPDSPFANPYFVATGIRSLIVVPILDKTQPLGALSIVSFTNDEAFGEDQIPLLESIARQLSEALQFQRLLDSARSSEARLRGVIEAVPGVIYTTPLPDLNPHYYSSRAYDLYGIDVQEMNTDSQSWIERVHPDDRDKYLDRIRKAIDGATNEFLMEYRIWNKTRREWVWLRNHAYIEHDADGRAVFATGFIQDVTDRALAEQALREAEHFTRLALDSMYDLFYVIGLDGRLLRWNRTFSTRTGYTDQEISRMLPTDFFNETHKTSIETAIKETIVTGSASIVLPLYTRDGQEIMHEFHAVVLRDTNGNAIGLVGTGRDITRQLEDEAQLQYIAQHDPLTGLPNRLLLSDRVAHAIKRARRDDTMLALLFLDLDRFKEINDTLGHACGDQLLKSVTERICDTLREDDSVARLGGDEFIILLEGLHAIDDAEDMAERLLTSIEQPLQLDDTQLVVTASIGISFFPKHGTDFDDLLKHADTAMYAAKESGRNSVHTYTKELSLKARHRFDLEHALRAAIENEDFHLHFQPKIDAASGRCVGAEALLRWLHPEEGNIPPDRFIPVAETTGLIIPLGEWVIRTACRSVFEFNQAGFPDLTLSLNLSGRQFVQRDLQQRILDQIVTADICAASIELELTESFLMTHPQARAMLLSLHEAGIRLAIDDFGTGYSSLSQLKLFPVSTLKIDQSFVHDVVTDPNDAAITSAIIAMGHSLDMTVCAEGVETQSQLEFVREQGCDTVQGYLFAPAMPKDEFLAWARGHQRD
ncbi:MAG: EAL domain-containing protein [Gammaproteobacteria bacterium]|jgi:diguanylate cyclase (GGDEF)-like protein/PAS domain S-box-containing protein